MANSLNSNQGLPFSQSSSAFPTPNDINGLHDFLPNSFYSNESNPTQVLSNSPMVNSQLPTNENLAFSNMINYSDSFSGGQDVVLDQIYKGSENANHFLEGQFFSQNETSNIQQILSSPAPTISPETYLKETDDYSLSYILREGLNYCSRINRNGGSANSNNNNNMAEQNANYRRLLKGKQKVSDGERPITVNKNQHSPTWVPRSSSTSVNGQQISYHNLQIGSSIQTKPEFPFEKIHQNPLVSQMGCSNSPSDVTRGRGGPIRTIGRGTPEMFPGFSPFKLPTWKQRNFPSGLPSYHGSLSRLSRSSFASQYDNWNTTLSRHQKWQPNIQEPIPICKNKGIQTFLRGGNKQNFQRSSSVLPLSQSISPGNNLANRQNILVVESSQMHQQLEKQPAQQTLENGDNLNYMVSSVLESSKTLIPLSKFSSGIEGAKMSSYSNGECSKGKLPGNGNFMQENNLANTSKATETDHPVTDFVEELRTPEVDGTRDHIDTGQKFETETNGVTIAKNMELEGFDFPDW